MIDSSGVGALVSLYKRVRAQGGNVVIKGVRDQPLAIFRLLRLDKLMLRAERSRRRRAQTASGSDPRGLQIFTDLTFVGPTSTFLGDLNCIFGVP